MSTDRLTERTKILRWLSIGTRMAIDNHKRPTQGHAIWDLLREAIDVHDRMPDRERFWLSSGTKAAGMANIGLTKVEALELEKLRILCAMYPGDGRRAGWDPQAPLIDMSDDVLTWFRYLVRDRQGPDDLRKAAMILLRRGEHDDVAKIYPKRKSRLRQLCLEVRVRATAHILAGLRDDFSIVPDPTRAAAFM